MGWAKFGILLTAFWVCLLEALLSGVLLAGLYELQAPGGQWLNAWFYGLFLLKILCCQSIGLWLLAFFYFCFRHLALYLWMLALMSLLYAGLGLWLLPGLAEPLLLPDWLVLWLLFVCSGYLSLQTIRSLRTC